MIQQPLSWSTNMAAEENRGPGQQHSGHPSLGHRHHVFVRGVLKVICAHRAQLGGGGADARPRQLLSMYLQAEAQAPPALQNPDALVEGKRSFVTEHINETRQITPSHLREELLLNHSQISRSVGAEFIWDHVSRENRRNHLSDPLGGEVGDHLQLLQFVLQGQPITGLHLHRGHSVRDEIEESLPR